MQRDIGTLASPMTTGLLRVKRILPQLLSGLPQCGRRGDAYTIVSKGRLACSALRERGTCDNRFTVPIADVDRCVLERIDTRLRPVADHQYDAIELLLTIDNIRMF